MATSPNRRRVRRQLQGLVETDGLVLTVFDDEWVYREHVYIALYKPANFECSRKPSHHPGVLTLLPEQFTWRDVQPVGRLDHDTTGLLLMSDDGPFIHAQSSPKRHVPKVYQATTAEPVTAGTGRPVAGRRAAARRTGAAGGVTCVQRGEHQLEIVLEQGKYHQVKRMLAAAGNHCSALHRSAIGGLTLDSLGIKPRVSGAISSQAQLDLLSPA
jgi:16S rRNA pseudouridine516 synthase